MMPYVFFFSMFKKKVTWLLYVFFSSLILNFLILFSFYSTSLTSPPIPCFQHSAISSNCPTEDSNTTDSDTDSDKSTENTTDQLTEEATKTAGDILPTAPNPTTPSCQSIEAIKCCSEPMACLGGNALSVGADIAKFAGIAGPGIALAVQTMGKKDMSGVCDLMSKLTLGHSALTVAAQAKCRSSINSCNNQCDTLIKAKCTEAQQPTVLSPNTPETDPKCQAIAQAIVTAKQTQVACLAEKKQLVSMGENLAEMAQSLISAYACKLQGRNIANEQDCKNKKSEGFRWVNGECINPQAQNIEQCEKQGGVWKNNNNCHLATPVSPVSFSETTTTDIPGTDSLGVDLQPVPNSEEPSPPNNNIVQNPDDRGGGGGGDLSDIDAITDDGLKLHELADLNPTSSDQSGLIGRSGGRGSISGGGSNFRGVSGYYYPSRRKKNSKEQDDHTDFPNIGGGGGFAGYGGKGGFGDNNRGYGQGRNFKLSKDKLAELKKKEGAKRTSSAEKLGGAHQVIFERITNRFKSLCQSKINCK